VDYFCVNREGRFAGEAFMVLCSEQQVEAALAKHKSYIGKRYVEVFRARRSVSSSCEKSAILRRPLSAAQHLKRTQRLLSFVCCMSTA
jgi:hypothetical protein